ncbi:MAG: complex I NDUFA9 subunit family protein [Candidatus Competibacteraceae bacterium]|nr:complex I NDUFA9 subunit family protein [Candidatus Competibacteraceae bacterium]
MKIKTICILGGTGFVGRHLVTRLYNQGFQVRILTRHREQHREFMVMPTARLIEADVHDQEALTQQFAGCDGVINLIAILNGSEAAFRKVHVELPGKIVTACKRAGVKRLLHMSALGAAETGPSLYQRTKAEGEGLVHQEGGGELRVTSFRPSIIFGLNDHFFTLFANMLKFFPVMPLPCAGTRFAPVYVEDVARALAASLGNQATYGQRLELCGPKTYTFRELVEYAAELVGHKRLILPMPDNLARLQARIMSHIPGAPFTLDNYHSMQVDNVCSSNALPALDIQPLSLESVMPQYFQGKASRGRYRSYRSGARR